MSEIVVIGGGISGILTALELASNHHVLLVEAANELLPDSCTSRNQCFKLHTGMHYFGDLNTAKACLIRSIAFARAFPDCILGGQNINISYRRGRHFVMSTSLVSPSEALAVANSLRALYEQLIKEDPQNQVFGLPERFFSVLDPAEYGYLSSDIPYYDEHGHCHRTKVVLGLETAESLVDFEALRQRLREKVSLCTNIRVLTGTSVTGLTVEPDRHGYNVQVISAAGTPSAIKAPFVINCAWQNIELIEKTLCNHSSTKDSGVNRVKITILVKLPDTLHTLNTSLFSTGPYCSVTILENGDAILASERLTNIGFYPVTEKMPPELEEIIRKKTSLETDEGQLFARQILEDCSAYFNPTIQALMKTAIIKELRVGVVKHPELTKAYNHASIYKMDSVIHSRLDTGVKSVAPGYIVNASMKMIYAQSNATLVKQLIEYQLRLQQNNQTIALSPSPDSFFGAPACSSARHGTHLPNIML